MHSILLPILSAISLFSLLCLGRDVYRFVRDRRSTEYGDQEENNHQENGDARA